MNTTAKGLWLWSKSHNITDYNVTHDGHRLLWYIQNGSFCSVRHRCSTSGNEPIVTRGNVKRYILLLLLSVLSLLVLLLLLLLYYRYTIRILLRRHFWQIDANTNFDRMVGSDKPWYKNGVDGEKSNCIQTWNPPPLHSIRWEGKVPYYSNRRDERIPPRCAVHILYLRPAAMMLLLITIVRRLKFKEAAFKFYGNGYCICTANVIRVARQLLLHVWGRGRRYYRQ